MRYRTSPKLIKTAFHFDEISRNALASGLLYVFSDFDRNRGLAPSG